MTRLTSPTRPDRSIICLNTSAATFPARGDVNFCHDQLGRAGLGLGLAVTDLRRFGKSVSEFIYDAFSTTIDRSVVGERLRWIFDFPPQTHSVVEDWDSCRVGSHPGFVGLLRALTKEEQIASGQPWAWIVLPIKRQKIRSLCQGWHCQRPRFVQGRSWQHTEAAQAWRRASLVKAHYSLVLGTLVL